MIPSFRLTLVAATSLSKEAFLLRSFKRFREDYIPRTGTSRTHPNNLRNKAVAALKRVAKRRAKKGYAHAKGKYL